MTTSERVSLEKTAANEDLADDVEVADDDGPGAELIPRPRADVELVDDRPHLVTRVRQASARGSVWLVDQPVVGRAAAVTRQAPRAGLRLALCAPRGAARVGGRVVGWVTDAEGARLLARHAEAGEGESYARVADARARAGLAGRRAILGVVVGGLVLLGLAWWATAVFAGVLGVGAFVAVAALVPRRELTEWLYGLGFAALVGGAGWWWGDDLAALVPRPPGWAWWVIAGVVVVVLGWVGRREDRPLVDMPVGVTASKPPPITAPMIVEALFRIGVAGMTQTAADKGMRDEVRVRAPGVGRAQHGWQVELELPPGITAGDVGEKREELAGALRRPLGCIWPSGGGDHPAHLRIYIGDKPMATARQAEWPLAAGQPIDLFEPFPLFTDEEGRWVPVTLLGTHAVVAGASGFGKSVTLRQLAVACALDPRVQVIVFDGKISGDLSPLQRIAHGYHEGAEPEDIAEQLAALQAVEAEMKRRARFLRDLPPDERSPKVTSELADRYPHLAPIALLIDEVQEYTEYGVKGSKEDKQVRDQFVASLTRISRLGRSAGIAMVLVSQKPEASVIPTSIMGNCAIRICHKVTEQNHNDQVLGTSAYKNGYNAALFSQADRGLAWLRAEGDPQVVRSWSAMVDLDAAEVLVDRAYALRRRRGLLTGQAADDGIEDAEVVYDLLADSEQVMTQRGRGKAQWAELVQWLADLRPGQWGELTVDGLSATARAAGIAPRGVRVGEVIRKGVYISDLRKRGGEDDEL
ncbi:MAG: FtsK/SpoIIIE domain-containing protein [Phycicoccus sp.]